MAAGERRKGRPRPSADLRQKVPEKGAVMIDVGGKDAVDRRALAQGRLVLRQPTLEAIRLGRIAKGDVVVAAQVAGLQAVKRTPEALPHCHPIPLTGATVEVSLEEAGLLCRCEVHATYRTGVEMDALHGCAVALLTAWDMVKALEKDERGQYPHTVITDLRVVAKEKGP